MNYLKLLVSMIEKSDDWAILKPYVDRAKDELSAMKEAPLKNVHLTGARSSVVVPEHVVGLVAMLENVMYKNTLPAVLIALMAYVRLQPDMLDTLEGLYYKPVEEAQNNTEVETEKQEENETAVNTPQVPAKENDKKSRKKRNS